MLRVQYTADARRQFDALPPAVRPRVLKIAERLERWPQVSGAKPLRGKFAGSYRIRTGDYRVQFRPAGDEIIIQRIGHRDGFYEE
ncbi:MAG TPA: type II toxin-antitoxin system RelE/ParE family toxin [Pirellulales bacterium]